MDTLSLVWDALDVQKEDDALSREGHQVREQTPERDGRIGVLVLSTQERGDCARTSHGHTRGCGCAARRCRALQRHTTKDYMRTKTCTQHRANGLYRAEATLRNPLSRHCRGSKKCLLRKDLRTKGCIMQCNSSAHGTVHFHKPAQLVSQGSGRACAMPKAVRQPDGSENQKTTEGRAIQRKG